MYCGNCGAKNDENSLFCGECGAPLREDQPASPMPADTTPPSSSQEELLEAPIPINSESSPETASLPKKKKKRLWIILVAAAVILCAAGGAYFDLNTGSRLADKEVAQGNTDLAANQYDKAIGAFQMAVKADQQETDAYIGLANAYTVLKNTQAAESSLKDGIKAVPKAETLYLKLATVYENAGDDDTALQTLQSGYNELKTTKLKAALNSLSNQLNQGGISSGNLVNGGLVAQSDGWLYYNDHGFYKVKTDGTGKTKLADDTALDINVVGDWIYYTDMKDTNTTYLYKMRTDGSDRMKLSSKIGLYPNVVGDWIYYIGITDGSSAITLCRMKTDGSADTMLANHLGQYINVYNGWIYYWTEEMYNSSGIYYDLCKMKTDGTGKTVLATGKAATAFNVSGDWLYYIDFFTTDPDQPIYRMRTDGTGKTKLNDDAVENFNVQGGWIYYLASNTDQGNILYKMRPDGSDRTQLAADSDSTVSSGMLNIAGGWIYYEDGNDSHPFKVHTDGSDKTSVATIGINTGNSSSSQSDSSSQASSASSSSSQIPSDAVSYNGHHYKLFNNNVDWSTDEKYCENLGGHLATITSQGENDFLYKYIKSNNTDSAYFGGVKKDGAWTWSDGETFSYTDWASGEPNDQSDSEAYAMFYFKYTDGTWNDGDGLQISEDNGNSDCPFICEWDR
ncbi:MAG: DUF5050 domain-containing protein [Sporolactobacillus sp.]